MRLALLAVFLALPLAASAQSWHPTWVRLTAPKQDGAPAETLEVFSRPVGSETWIFRGAKGPFVGGYCPKGCDLAVARIDIPKGEEVAAWLKRGSETSPMSNIAPPGSFLTSKETVTEACCAVTEFCCRNTDVNHNGVVDDVNDRFICAELLAGRYE